MRVLGVETSCDETAVALLDVEADGAASVLAEEISSQVAVHERYGGVVPELASREHLTALPLLFDAVLSSSSARGKAPELVAVTRGPGLKGCLLVGYTFARSFALVKNIPLVPVNHIEGHLLAPMLDNPTLRPPYLALVVSGGHTEIVLVRATGAYEIRARTRDDAAGEAFDKSAALLGLPYPGGPRLAALADSVASSRFTLPRVMREGEGFSFSGLKTAIGLLIKKVGEAGVADPGIRAEICFAVQEAIVDTLVHKILQEVQSTGVRTVVVTGGVSANRRLREAISRLPGVDSYSAHPRHCTDNAAMIGYAGALAFLSGRMSKASSDVAPSWRVEDLCVG